MQHAGTQEAGHRITPTMAAYKVAEKETWRGLKIAAAGSITGGCPPAIHGAALEGQRPCSALRSSGSASEMCCAKANLTVKRVLGCRDCQRSHGRVLWADGSTPDPHVRAAERPQGEPMSVRLLPQSTGLLHASAGCCKPYLSSKQKYAYCRLLSVGRLVESG